MMRRRLRHPFEIDISNYRRGELIKHGGFGYVYKATNNNTNEEFAAKIILSDNNSQQRELINREIEMMMNLRHPTFVPFVGFSQVDFHNDPNIVLLMKLARNGSLENVIKQNIQGIGPHDYTNTTRQEILIGISRSMKYLHDRNIIHRDLKPANVLLDDNFLPMITDFGLSKCFDVGHTYSQSTFGGTLPYTAPEIHRNERYGPKVDVYSFGILMYEVLTDSYAYPKLQNKELGDLQFRNAVTQEGYRPFTESNPCQYPLLPLHQELMVRCWSDDPNQRPTFGEIFNLLKTPEYFLPDVDSDDIDAYIEYITIVNDPIEQLIIRNEQLENENKELQRSITQLQNPEPDFENAHINEVDSIVYPLDIFFHTPPCDCSSGVVFVFDVTPQELYKGWFSLNDLFSSKESLCFLNFTGFCDTVFSLIFYDRKIDRTRLISYSIVLYLGENIAVQNFKMPNVNTPFHVDNHPIFNFFEDQFNKLLSEEGNNNQPCNYIRVINRIKRLNWGSKDYKNIIWVASNPAQGPSFSGETDHQAEDHKLTELLQELSNDNFYFFGYPVNDETRRTFNVIQSIFNEKYKSIEKECDNFNKYLESEFKFHQAYLPPKPLQIQFNK